jgi:hypothetical protein
MKRMKVSAGRYHLAGLNTSNSDISTAYTELDVVAQENSDAIMQAMNLKPTGMATSDYQAKLGVFHRAQGTGSAKDVINSVLATGNGDLFSSEGQKTLENALETAVSDSKSATSTVTAAMKDADKAFKAGNWAYGRRLIAYATEKQLWAKKTADVATALKSALVSAKEGEKSIESNPESAAVSYGMAAQQLAVATDIANSTTTALVPDLKMYAPGELATPTMMNPDNRIPPDMGEGIPDAEIGSEASTFRASGIGDWLGDAANIFNQVAQGGAAVITAVKGKPTTTTTVVQAAPNTTVGTNLQSLYPILAIGAVGIAAILILKA